MRYIQNKDWYLGLPGHTLDLRLDKKPLCLTKELGS